MNVLVWQWGRRGGGPRIAVEMAAAMSQLTGVRGQLSLSDRTEILGGPSPPHCDLLMPTYDGIVGFAWRLLCAPFLVPWLVRRLRGLRPVRRKRACGDPVPVVLPGRSSAKPGLSG